MKILVAGSSGLIGKALLPCLLGAGHEVSILVRKQEEAGGSAILWNPDQGIINPSDLEGFDAIINLAGENIANERWSGEKKLKILESRVKATRLLAHTLAHLKSPPRVWINASAVGYYGNKGDLLVTEASPVGEGFLARVCAKWEEAAAEAKKKGIRLIYARFGIVLTPKGGLLKRILTPFKFGLGGIVGDGKQYMSWIAIDDLLGVMAHFLKNEEIEGAVNVVAPQPVSNFEFTKTLGKVVGKPTVIPLPAFAVKLIFGKEMAEEMLLSSVRVQPKKLLESGYVFHYPKLEKALRNYIA